MSNALAIATVTTALAQIVRTAAQSMVAGSDVVTGPPDPSGSPANRIHLFLYQVSPNGAMRNNDLPMRSADGKLVMRPTAAINLHYLLAFYGSGSDLETQRMLGAVVRDLHAKPLLTRTVIQDAISSQTFLTDSNLADAVEQVKFSPLAVSLEEMAKLWSVFFQTPYALSLAYEAAVVLIESELQTQPALPVLKRGDTDQGVDTLLGPFAVLEKAYFGMDQDPILRPRPISLPAARLGLAVILGGRNLSGEGGLLRFRHSRLDVSHELSPEPADVSAKELKIRLPEPGSGTSQTDWAPGVYTVTVVQNRPGTDRECTSNALPIPLSPIITAIEPGTTIARDDDGAATLTITCRPRVRAEQRTVLLVAGREITGTIDDDDPDKIVFVMEDAEAVTDAIIRLRVDGIESMPFSREDAPPPPHFVFDPNQRVSIT
ncbi:hypothetical protein Dvar_22450 [Desulfosarcina variabilis str. Montpellier]|uniref:DUF4255 domain-containing protein n=1 Tax=Desulfosarcina variabilis TaxID=2300 RepID=UPI003AFA7B35